MKPEVAVGSSLIWVRSSKKRRRQFCVESMISVLTTIRPSPPRTRRYALRCSDKDDWIQDGQNSKNGTNEISQILKFRFPLSPLLRSFKEWSLAQQIQIQERKRQNGVALAITVVIIEPKSRNDKQKNLETSIT
jgi:hypothetical protein